MSKLVKQLASNKQVIFDYGSFDNWCVYIVDKQNSYAPTDIEYFTALQLLARRYPQSKIYNDFIKIYNLTTTQVEAKVVDLIDSIVSTYKWNDAAIIEQWLTVLYAAMIAEENKKKAILKKRIKRLGLYQLFFKNYTPLEAANFSKGKNWKELDAIMKKHNI
jgi:hypothetical protein